MLYFVKNDELINELSKLKSLGQSVGLVPTMGALHDGHLSLVRRARENDVVVVSLFVNPLQFNNPSDLENYPRNLEKDKEKLDGLCDMLYAPEYEELYPSRPRLSMNFGEMEANLEGKFRPGHFNGVGIVVSKLLNIVKPDKAYFGLKDLQQITIIKSLVRDLSLQTDIVGCPILREENGLAMSSRNERLSSQGRDIAANIYKGLKIGESLFNQNHVLGPVIDKVKSFYVDVEGFELEYCEAVNGYFEILNETSDKGPISLCVAGFVEGVRLIDNLYLRSE